MKVSLVLVVCLMAVLAVAGAVPAWWKASRAPRRSQPRRDSYRSLCRIINPDPYAFPGKVPYPAAPFCPY